MAIIDQGKIIAIGTPREIQARTLGTIAGGNPHRAAHAPRCPRLRGVRQAHAQRGSPQPLTVYSTRPARTLPDLVKWIDQHGLELEDIHLKRPTLEDVFIELTGKRLRD